MQKPCKISVFYCADAICRLKNPIVVVNVSIDPEMDVADQVYESDCIICNYYVLKDGRWGLLNETGSMILEPIYDDVIIDNRYNGYSWLKRHIRTCFEALYIVQISGLAIVRKKDRWGMLGGNGDERLPLAYDSIQTVENYAGRGNVYIVCQDGVYGVVDRFGKLLIPMIYPSLDCPVLDYMWDSSVFRIESEAGTGYVRLGDAKCLVAPQWERVDKDRLYLSGDAEPWGHIFTVWKDGHCGLIFDDQGMIIPPVWDEIIPRRFVFADPVSYSVRRGTSWGCYDASGHMICDAIWDEMGMYLNGIGCVKKDGKWGAIGADGELCVPLEWDVVEGFGVKSASDDSMAHTNTGVLLGLSRSTYTILPDCFSWVQRNGLWGLIDREGTVLVDPIWELHDGVYARRFDNGWVELEVCFIDSEHEEMSSENENSNPNVVTEQSASSITYHIEVRKVEENSHLNDEVSGESEPYEALEDIADDWFDELFSEGNLGED